MSAILAVICGLLVIGLDQLTKYLVTVMMEVNEVITVIPGVINLNRIPPNAGAAFGMFSGQTWFLITVTCVIMIVCVAMLIRKTFDSKLMFWALCLVLGGGVGNLIDRVFRGGNVVDFLEFDFIDFPVFNVADIAVCVGAGLIVVYFIIDFVRDAREKNAVAKINAEGESMTENKNDADSGENGNGN